MASSSGSPAPGGPIDERDHHQPIEHRHAQSNAMNPTAAEIEKTEYPRSERPNTPPDSAPGGIR